MVQRFQRERRNADRFSEKGCTLDRFALFLTSGRRTYRDGDRINERRFARNARCCGVDARTVVNDRRKTHGGFGLCHLQHRTILRGFFDLRHQRRGSRRRSLGRSPFPAKTPHSLPSFRVDKQNSGRENRIGSSITTRIHREKVEISRTDGR